MIETNKKRKLYAPYVSALEPNKLERAAEKLQNSYGEDTKRFEEISAKLLEGGKKMSEGEMSDLAKKLEWLNEEGVSHGEPRLFGIRQITVEDLKNAMLYGYTPTKDPKNPIAVEYNPRTDETYFTIYGKDHVAAYYIALKGKYEINPDPRMRMFQSLYPVEAKVDTETFYKFIDSIHKFNNMKDRPEDVKGASFDIEAVRVIKPAGSDTITIKPEGNTKYLEIPELKLKALSNTDVSIDDSFSVDYIYQFLRKIRPLAKDGELNFNVMHPESKENTQRVLNITTKSGDETYGMMLAHRWD